MTTDIIPMKLHTQKLVSNPTWSFDGSFILDISEGIWKDFSNSLFEIIPNGPERAYIHSHLLHLHGGLHPIFLAMRYIAALGHEDFDDVQTRERTGSEPEQIKNHVINALRRYPLDYVRIADAYYKLARDLHAFLHQTDLYIDGYCPYIYVIAPSSPTDYYDPFRIAMCAFAVEPIRIYHDRGDKKETEIGCIVKYMRRADFKEE